MKLSKSLILGSAFLSLATISSAATMPIATLLQPANTTVTVINVSGTFEDQAVLSGWFDISNRQITSAEMQVSGIDGIFTLDSDAPNAQAVNTVVGSRRITVLEGISMEDNGNILSLSLLLPLGTVSLDNYTGGALCGSSSNCGSIVSYYLPVETNDPILSSGFAVAAPEPGATALLGTGLSALGVFFRRRFAKK